MGGLRDPATHTASHNWGAQGLVVDAPGAMQSPASLGSEPQGTETGVNKGRGGALRGYQGEPSTKDAQLGRLEGLCREREWRDRLKGEFESKWRQALWAMQECPCTSASLAEHLLWEINPNKTQSVLNELVVRGGDGHIHASIKGE